MKKYQTYLFKLAEKFNNKYAQDQDLKQIIENAASYGEQSANGIMNFPAELAKDRARMRFSVTISPGMMGGRKAEVSTPSVEPSQFAPKYSKLPDQIKNYLNKHLENFPQIPNGTTVLFYSGQPDEDLAQR